MSVEFTVEISCVTSEGQARAAAGRAPGIEHAAADDDGLPSDADQPCLPYRLWVVLEGDFYLYSDIQARRYCTVTELEA